MFTFDRFRNRIGYQSQHLWDRHWHVIFSIQTITASLKLCHHDTVDWSFVNSSEYLPHVRWKNVQVDELRKKHFEKKNTYDDEKVVGQDSFKKRHIRMIGDTGDAYIYNGEDREKTEDFKCDIGRGNGHVSSVVLRESGTTRHFLKLISKNANLRTQEYACLSHKTEKGVGWI